MFQTNFVLADTEHNHESEIEEGRELVESKVSCDQLGDEQFEAIGEYLMEQMHPGESHGAIHKMMNMEEGTEYHKQFHVNMAKTMYCGDGGMMNNMMMGNGIIMGNWGMMGSGWGWFGWIFMILFWLLIIVGIVVLIKWLINQSKGSAFPPKADQPRAEDILKERYAKGEIPKKEFEEKKKDLK